MMLSALFLFVCLFVFVSALTLKRCTQLRRIAYRDVGSALQTKFYYYKRVEEEASECLKQDALIDEAIVDLHLLQSQF
jgi:hypothetical protein